MEGWHKVSTGDQDPIEEQDSNFIRYLYSRKGIWLRVLFLLMETVGFALAIGAPIWGYLMIMKVVEIPYPARLVGLDQPILISWVILSLGLAVLHEWCFARSVR